MRDSRRFPIMKLEKQRIWGISHLNYQCLIIKMHICSAPGDKCIKCYKLRNVLLGNTLPRRKRSAKYQVLVLYQSRSPQKLRVKVYPLPKKFESCVYTQVSYLDSSSESDYRGINFVEEDSDTLFDSLISYSEANAKSDYSEANAKSEEEMYPVVQDKLDQNVLYGKNQTLELETDEYSSGSDTVNIYRLIPAAIWFYELASCEIRDIKVIKI